MTQWHMKSGRKPSGGILRTGERSDKKLVWKGGLPAATSVVEKQEEVEIETQVRRGKTEKQRMKKAFTANVSDPKTNKTQKAGIIDVFENEADRHFVRRNVITKGALLRIKYDGTEKLAKVTSRPGQAGVVEAILLEREPEKPQKKKKQVPENAPKEQNKQDNAEKEQK